MWWVATLFFFPLEAAHALSETFLMPVKIGDSSLRWRTRGLQPLTETERNDIKKLRELSIEEAIPRLGWLMVERESMEARQFASEVILSFPNWRDFLSDRLTSAAKRKSPPELFGGDRDSVYAKSMADESIPVLERKKVTSVLPAKYLDGTI